MDGYVSGQRGFQFAGRRTPHRCLALGNHFLEQPILLHKVFDIVEISERDTDRCGRPRVASVVE